MIVRGRSLADSWPKMKKTDKMTNKSDKAGVTRALNVPLDSTRNFFCRKLFCSVKKLLNPPSANRDNHMNSMNFKGVFEPEADFHVTFIYVNFTVWLFFQSFSRLVVS